MLESLEVTGPEGLGPLTTSMGWRMGSIFSSGSTDAPDAPTVPTALDVTPNETIVYLKDGGIYVASRSLRPRRQPDQRRAAHVHAAHHQHPRPEALRQRQPGLRRQRLRPRRPRHRTRGHLRQDVRHRRHRQRVRRLDARPVARTAGSRCASSRTEEVTGGTPYSWVFALPARYFTRTEGDVGGNTVVVLTAHAWYDPDGLGGVFTSTVVNSLAAGSL